MVTVINIIKVITIKVKFIKNSAILLVILTIQLSLYILLCAIKKYNICPSIIKNVMQNATIEKISLFIAIARRNKKSIPKNDNNKKEK